MHTYRVKYIEESWTGWQFKVLSQHLHPSDCHKHPNRRAQGIEVCRGKVELGVLHEWNPSSGNPYHEAD